MKSINDEKELFKKLMSLFQMQFGDNCEVVLHDLTKEYDSTIVDIVNGHVTDRKVGDGGTNLGLEVLRGTKKDGDSFNYITNTRNGKVLRSSSIYFHDEEGNVIGALCVNIDITEGLRMEKFIHSMNGYSLVEDKLKSSEVNEEFITNNVAELMDFLLAQAQKHVGVPPLSMDKENKLDFLQFLDAKGAFLISKSSEKVCDFLNISKYTLYNYLDIVRKRAERDHKSK